MRICHITESPRGVEAEPERQQASVADHAPVRPISIQAGDHQDLTRDGKSLPNVTSSRARQTYGCSSVAMTLFSSAKKEVWPSSN